MTHAHIEGIADAIGVAVAAALRFGGEDLKGVDYIDEVLRFMPNGKTFDRMVASRLIAEDEIGRAVPGFGTGEECAAFDTVPFCIWMVAHHDDNFADALWKTAGGFGDSDTTCAIVAGNLCGSGLAIPQNWRKRREDLPTQMDIIAL
ncbi:MAG: ADP-ribosylglycohydrolase [Bradymonadia bacterium]|jgi:ADP-ribosylglycohydrolase